MAISDGSKAVEAALSLWAKSAPYHLLLSHMLDTAALALAVLEREPRRPQALYAEDWGLEPEEAGRFVSFLVGLHDLGKASPVFQAAWPEGAQRVWNLGLTWDKELVRERLVAHGVFTELYVTEALKAFGFSPRAANKLAKGLGAHHGFLVHPGERELGLHHVKNEPPSWQEARNHLVKRLVDCLGLTALIGRPLRDVSEPAVLRVMALASFADWIASECSPHTWGWPAYRGAGEKGSAVFSTHVGMARCCRESRSWATKGPPTHGSPISFPLSPIGGEGGVRGRERPSHPHPGPLPPAEGGGGTACSPTWWDGSIYPPNSRRIGQCSPYT